MSEQSANEASAHELQIRKEQRKVGYTTSEWTTELLVQKMDKGTLVIPDYQREFIWPEENKCRFIESLLLRLPIPYIFVAQSEDGQSEIVDGAQRSYTIRAFLSDKLRLANLKILDELNGLKFQDLDPGRQNLINDIPLRIIVMSADTNPESRQEVFERINTSSVKALPPEIRRGAMPGPYLELVVDLARSKKFKRLAPLSKMKRQRRLHEELVSRFFAYGDGLEEYKDNPQQFIDEHFRSMNQQMKNNPALAEEYRQRFTRMLDWVDEVLENGFAKTATAGFTPNARFEAIAIGVSNALESGEMLRNDEEIREMLRSSDFNDVVGADGANVKSKLIGRIEYVKNGILA